MSRSLGPLAAVLALGAVALPAHSQEAWSEAREAYGPHPLYAEGPAMGYPAPYAAESAPWVEDLTVRAAPRSLGRSSTTGAPIRLVSVSRVVTYRDLDLATPWGARELESRIKQAARSACREIDVFHPIATSDSPPCYRAAVEDALAQAQIAVEDAQRRW